VAHRSHFVLGRNARNTLHLLIFDSKQTPKSRAHGGFRDTYWAILAVTIAGIAVTVVFSAFPIPVGAFWPFTTTRAAEEVEPVLHDSSLALLDPATNPDPNPAKGGLRLATTENSALIAGASIEGTLPSSASVVGGGGGAISLYEVREGDSLSDIAEMFGVSVNTILWANDLKSASDIHPGDNLLILPVSGVQHKVAKGDTLAKIAKKYDADLEEVAIYNGLDTDVALAVGETIIVPGGDHVVTTKSSTSTKKSSTTAKALPAVSGYFGNPVPGGRLTQGVHGNNGVDIGAPSGTPIYASASGTIIVAKSGGGYNGGYGNYIVISHDNGTQTLYAHMSGLAVSGGAVAKGDLIGYVGNTGRSTGNHLHFEVRGARNPFAN